MVDDRGDEHGVLVPMAFVDDLAEAASISGDVVQALECVRIAIESDRCDPEVYIAGVIGVLLLAAKHVHGSANALSDEAERLLEIKRLEMKK
ncbi:hypothetical protein [Raoultibacter massiliensis]|uniref:hypothetical protein n=2 Tax=Raoultibacter massiliensis TaxID=1852371 RepID=UPI000C84038A